MEDQQLEQMVREAATAAGYDSPKLYHGTKAFGFTEFDMETILQMKKAERPIVLVA